MQFIIEAIKANQDDEGKIKLDELETVIKTEFPKYAVPKDQYNNVATNLKTANDTLEKLQKDNKDVSALQTQIDEYKKQVEEKVKELAKTKQESTLKETLREAGAKDIDYMLFKLGELETDAEGNIKDLDNKIKSLKESTPDHFAASEDKGAEDDKGGNGYKVLDGKLPTGTPTKETGPKTLGAALADHYDKK